MIRGLAPGLGALLVSQFDVCPPSLPLPLLLNNNKTPDPFPARADCPVIRQNPSLL